MSHDAQGFNFQRINCLLRVAFSTLIFSFSQASSCAPALGLLAQQKGDESDSRIVNIYIYVQAWMFLRFVSEQLI